MTVLNSAVEIDSKCSREMAQRDPRLIWVLGTIDARRHQCCRSRLAPNIHSIRFKEIMTSKDPEKLVGRSPCFCLRTRDNVALRAKSCGRQG